jgi:hypothetical protein
MALRRKHAAAMLLDVCNTARGATPTASAHAIRPPIDVPAKTSKTSSSDPSHLVSAHSRTRTSPVKMPR